MSGLAKRLALVGLVLIATGTGVGAVASGCPQVGFTLVEPHATRDTRPVKWGNTTIFVHKMPITKTSEITGIKVVSDGMLLDGPDDAVIQLRLTPAADQRLHAATTNHSGMRVAFMFGDQVMNNVVWQGPYGMDTGGVQISLSRGRQLAKSLPGAVKGCTADAAGRSKTR